MSKKSEKLIQIVNIDGKIFILLKDLRIFNEIFKKDVNYDNITSRKKIRAHPLSRSILEKSQWGRRGSNHTRPSGLLRVKT